MKAGVPSHRTGLIIRLNEIIRRFQQASGFGLRSYGKGVTQALSLHSLSLVCGEPHCTIERLIAVVNAPQPTVSRAVRQLESQGFIRCERSAADARYVQLIPTLLGRQHHAADNAALWKIYDKLVSSLTQEEREELYELQRRFADGLQAQQCDFTPDVHPMQRQVARITRGLQLLRTDMFRKFKISILGWNFLSQISLEQRTLHAKELCNRFNAPVNTVASVILALQRERLIQRVEDREDRRILRLAITSRGSGVLTRIRKLQLSQLEDGVQSLHDPELERLVVLSEKYLAEGATVSTEKVISPKVSIKAMHSSIDKRRVLTLLSAYGNSLEHLGKDTHIVGLFANDILVGGGVFRRSSSNEIATLAAHIPKHLSNPAMQNNFKEMVRELLH